MSRLSPLLTIIDAAVRKASRSLLRDFKEVEQLQVSRKGPADFVSAADRKADKILREELSKARPAFGFLTEEGEDVKGDGVHRWIIDPLDGTTNFLHAIPHFAISVALEKEGVVVAGYIYDLIKDEFFWGEKGDGAFSSRSGRLRVSGRKDLSECLLATGIPFKGCGNIDEFNAELAAVAMEVSGVRRMGAAALDLAYVAAGRFDAYWERDLAVWDVAAALLLVKEAGGHIRQIDGKEATHFSPDLIAANTAIGETLRQLLHNSGQKPEKSKALA